MTPDFSVTWSFRKRFNILIYYQRWKPFLLLNIFWEPVILVQKYSCIKCQKQQHLFKVEIFCNNVNYHSKVWGQYVFFGISFLKEMNAFIQQGLVLCINTHMFFFQQWMVLNSNFFNSLFLPQLSYPVQWIMEAVSKNVSNFLKFTSSAAADVGTSSQRMESAADVSRSLHLSKSDIYQWLVLIVLRFVEFYKN